jgi:hypothetical protein
MGAPHAQTDLFAGYPIRRLSSLLLGIFFSNAIAFVPLGQQIGKLFEVLPPYKRTPGT